MDDRRRHGEAQALQPGGADGDQESRHRLDASLEVVQAGFDQISTG